VSGCLSATSRKNTDYKNYIGDASLDKEVPVKFYQSFGCGPDLDLNGSLNLVRLPSPKILTRSPLQNTVGKWRTGKWRIAPIRSHSTLSCIYSAWYCYRWSKCLSYTMF